MSTNVTSVIRQLTGERGTTRIGWTEGLLILSLIIGTAVRIPMLNYSFNGDELWQVSISAESISTIIDVVAQDVHPPLYSILLHYWLLVFPREWGSRLFSLICVLAAIWMTYALGRQLGFPLAGAVASFLMAISSFAVELSQEARQYALLMLIWLLSMYFLVGWIQTRRLWQLIGWIAASVLGLYSQYFTVFLLFTQTLMLVRLGSKDKRSVALSMLGLVLIGLAFVPWLPVLGPQMDLRSRMMSLPSWTVAFSPKLALPELGVTFSLGYTGVWVDHLSNLSRNYSTGQILANWPVLLALALGFGGALLLGLKRSFGLGWTGTVIVLWLTLPILLAYLTAIVLGSATFKPKFLSGTLPAYFLLVGLGLEEAGRSRRVLLLVPFVIVLGLSMYSLYNYHFRDTEFGRKGNWRALTEYIQANERPGDVILFHTTAGGLTGSAPFVRYYYRGDLPFEGIFDSGDGQSLPWTPTQVEQRLQQVAKRSERIWFVSLTGHEDLYDPQGLVSSWLNSNVTLLLAKRFNPILDLYLYGR